MSRITGTQGVVKIGANTVAAVTDFGLEESADAVEDTALGETAKRYQSDRTGWTGSVNCMWDKSDSTGQETITIGATVSLHLIPEGGASGDSDFNGSAIVTGISRAISAGSIVTKNITVQGSGALSESTLP